MRKNILLFAATLFLASASFASGNPELAKELSDKVIVDLSDVELDECSPEFVLVTFEIVKGEIVIRETNSTNAELTEILLRKLFSLRIEADYVEGQVYNYKFSFTKV